MADEDSNDKHDCKYTIIEILFFSDKVVRILEYIVFLVLDLDKFILMPFFEQLSDENNSYYDHEFRINYYLSKNAGYLKLDNKKEYKKANKYIENLAAEHHLNYTLLRGY